MPLGRIGALWEQLLRDPHSATARAAGGDGYSRTEHLLFLAVDELRLGNWMRSKDGARGRNRPRRISPLAQPDTTRHGRVPDGRTPTEVRALLARHGAAQLTP